MADPAISRESLEHVARRRSAHFIVVELKAHVRRRKAIGKRDLVWSVNVGHMDDQILDEALVAMARVGCRGTWEREFGFVAHYTLIW